MTEIYFHSEEVNLPTPLDEPAIQDWLIALAQEENQEIANLNYIFCSDEHLLHINRDYLNHDYYTDIITFDYSQDQTIAGDIYISIDRIEENAREYAVGFQEELMRVIAHGCLHLIGYKDKTDEDQNLMTKKEEASLSLLRKLSVPRGTSE